MNCPRRQPGNTISKPSIRAHQHDSDVVEQIERILEAKRIDLTQLMTAISAVPGLEAHLYRFLATSGTRCVTMSEATVLAGRLGIRMVLREYLHNADKRSPAVLLFVPRDTSSLRHGSSAQIKSKLAEL